MKKVFFALLALCMVFVSCKSSSGTAKDKNAMENTSRKPLGIWKPMEWTSSDKINKDGHTFVVDVPSAKNNVELNCTNYNRFWISSVNGKGIAQNEKETFKGEFFEIKCVGNSLSVAFDENSSAERSFDLLIQSGDVFSRLKFVQKSQE